MSDINNILEKIKAGNSLHPKMFELFMGCLETSIKKASDYASMADPFANFRLSSELGICSVPQSIMVRSSDKFKRICNLMSKENAVENETISDSILDLINYMAILYVYIQNQYEMADQIKTELIAVLNEDNVECLNVIYHIDKDEFEILIVGEYNEELIHKICKSKGITYKINNYISAH
jgi:hypothetical protein